VAALVEGTRLWCPLAQIRLPHGRIYDGRRWGRCPRPQRLGGGSSARRRRVADRGKAVPGGDGLRRQVTGRGRGGALRTVSRPPGRWGGTMVALLDP
jgi:hypothetical protein